MRLFERAVRSKARSISAWMLLIATVAFSAGCGGGGGGGKIGGPPSPNMTISPAKVDLGSNASQTFIATVTNAISSDVTWSVREGASGGTVTSSGVYTAPTAAGTYHVVATSVALPALSALATVTVHPSVAISPTTATLSPGQSQTFTASVPGLTNSAVTWSVQEGAAGGSITTGGVYTAPNTAGTYHVVATSVAAPTLSAVATVAVHVGVSINPNAPTLTLGQSQTFTAAVAGTTSTAVTWSVQEGAAGGSITAGGVYTAPNTAGTYHVVATSQADPTQSATAIITVQAGSAVGTIQ